MHVALWESGELVAGAVAQPALGETFSTAAAPVVPDRTSERPRIAVSRTRPPAFVEALAAELGADLVPMGSAGVKVISVVRDISDAYVHAGGQYEWDNAAPVAVARAAGLFCSRIDGSELEYNQDDVSLPDLSCAVPSCPRRSSTSSGGTGPTDPVCRGRDHGHPADPRQRHAVILDRRLGRCG